MTEMMEFFSARQNSKEETHSIAARLLKVMSGQIEISS